MVFDYKISFSTFIEIFSSEKVWQKGRSKEYYTELTDTLRTYIQDRFGFNAMEMTSSEIIEDFPELTEQDIIACLSYAADSEKHTRLLKSA